VQHHSKNQNNIKKIVTIQCILKFHKLVVPSRITSSILLMLMWVILKATHLKSLSPKQTQKIINPFLLWKKTPKLLGFNLHQLQTLQLIFLDQNKLNSHYSISLRLFLKNNSNNNPSLRCIRNRLSQKKIKSMENLLSNNSNFNIQKILYQYL